MISFIKKHRMLIGSAIIATTFSSSVALANTVENNDIQNRNFEYAETKESQNVEHNTNKTIEVKTQLNAEDMYARAELAEQSELAKFTSTPEWLAIELIKDGEFGVELEEIKANLIKEGISFDDIDIEAILKEIEEEKIKDEVSISSSEIISLNDDNYNNLITNYENLGNLDNHRSESATRGGNSQQKSAEKAEQAVEIANSDKTNVIKAFPHKEFKSYMRWTALSPKSKQGKFSAKASPDPETAIMMYNGRYLVALGFAYADYVGQEIDIVMESGQIIPAVIGDFKAEKHTDEHNSTHLWDGSVVEFVVSSNEEAAKATNYSGSYNNIFPGLVKEFRK